MNALKTITDLVKRTRSAGDTIREGLESLRKQLRETQRRKEAIEAIPCDDVTAHARVDSLIEGWLIGAQRSAHIPTGADLAAAPAHVRGFEHTEGAAVLLHYLAPQLADAMKDEADRHIAETGSVTDQDRAEQLAKIDREILDLSLAEESLIRNAEAAGFPIHRRPNADPRAVLAHQDALP